MGRHCGWLALLAGIATGADFIFIPESPPESADWQTEMCELLKSVNIFPSLVEASRSCRRSTVRSGKGNLSSSSLRVHWTEI